MRDNTYENFNNTPVLNGSTFETNFSIFTLETPPDAKMDRFLNIGCPPFMALKDPTFNTGLVTTTSNVTATTGGALLCTFSDVEIDADTILVFNAIQYRAIASGGHGYASVGVKVDGATHWQNDYSMGLSGGNGQEVCHYNGGVRSHAYGYGEAGNQMYLFSVDTFGISQGTHDVEIWVKKASRTAGTVTLYGTGFHSDVDNNAVYGLTTAKLASA